jgi:hypothetical protein
MTERSDLWAWLQEPVALPIDRIIHVPVWEPFKKWMLLAGAYLVFLVVEIVGAIRLGR